MAFVCDQDGGPPLASDLDQGAGEEGNARQVEPGGVGEVQFLQQDNLEFKHLCDDWREGCDGQEAFDFSLSSG